MEMARLRKLELILMEHMTLAAASPILIFALRPLPFALCSRLSRQTSPSPCSPMSFSRSSRKRSGPNGPPTSTNRVPLPPRSTAFSMLNSPRPKPSPRRAIAPSLSSIATRPPSGSPARRTRSSPKQSSATRHPPAAGQRPSITPKARASPARTGPRKKATPGTTAVPLTTAPRPSRSSSSPVSSPPRSATT